MNLAEDTHLVTSVNYRTKVVGPTDKLDFTGPLGVYFREIFMHAPALLAAHHNARGDYAAAQAWYSTIFDPTADFDPGVDLEWLSEDDRLQAERDRVWQYAEFHGLKPAKLRELLEDEDAQAAYRKDPFNPYAIARMRISAFRKNIVMRYVSNLLDWGDSLFRKFQRETIDEAHVLYAMAQQILGPRPVNVGDCGQGAVVPRTYANIEPHIKEGQEFLIEVEGVVANQTYISARGTAPAPQREYVPIERADMYAIDLRSGLESKIAPELRFDSARAPSVADRVAEAARGSTEKMLGDDRTVAHMPDTPTAPPIREPLPEHKAEAERFRMAVAKDGIPGRQTTWKTTGTAFAERARARLVGGLERNSYAEATGDGSVASDERDWRYRSATTPDDFTTSVIEQVGPVFCVPRNKDLLKLWDRVENRLFNIRNCRNIDGEEMQPPLFSPEIDPNLLVRLRAAGLSMRDIHRVTAGNLPPYRFTYLIAKAREYAGLVQGFGAKLQGAIERRDAEELARLKLGQGINMQRLVSKIRENEVTIAEDTVSELNRRKAAIETRKRKLEGTRDRDLNTWERANQIYSHTGSVVYGLGVAASMTTGVLFLLPQLGAPTAMKFGGDEAGHSLKAWSEADFGTAKLNDNLSRSAAIEGSNERRREVWARDIEDQSNELKQLEKRIDAAKLRVEIAKKAKENHDEEKKHQEDLLDFYKGPESKFTNEELYSWMASSLQTVYEQAFNAADEMARLAEQAYRFERPGETVKLLAKTYWEKQKAGLLAGEKLSVDLLAMEKRFLETNYRVLEITQPFSVLQFDPAAVMKLREEGECKFRIPEVAFDLLYPGQYRRRIRSVRLTINCVTGPYVNIPATLTLTGAKMRVEPKLDGEKGLQDCLLRHTVQVATSTAQADSGVFDFSFSDPRYMPFEGAGAVESTWEVRLPKAFRPFNYASINDVILSISYSAEADGKLRDDVEKETTQATNALRAVLASEPLPRIISLRQEHSNTFHRLQTGAVGTAVELKLDERVLPFILRNDPIEIENALLLLKPRKGLSAQNTEIKLNGKTLKDFKSVDEFPGYVAADAKQALGAVLAKDHTLAINVAGDLAPTGGGTSPALAEDALEDLILYVELKLASGTS